MCRDDFVVRVFIQMINEMDFDKNPKNTKLL